MLIYIDVAVLVSFGQHAQHLSLLEVNLLACELEVQTVHHGLQLLDTQHTVTVCVVLLEDFLQGLAHLLFCGCLAFFFLPLF